MALVRAVKTVQPRDTLKTCRVEQGLQHHVITLCCISSDKRLFSFQQVIEFDDGSGSVLRIQPLRTPRDEAIYECHASNSAGELTASTRLSVLRGQCEHAFPVSRPTSCIELLR